MHWGFRMVEDMIDGLKNWMDEKGFTTIDDFRGASLPRVKDWKNLNLNYKIVAKIDAVKCIGCELCYIACWDGAHQCIRRPACEAGDETRHGHDRRFRNWTGRRPNLAPSRVPRVDEDECVGCNLCWLVCPVENCITMERVDRGIPAQSWEQRCQQH